MVWVLPAEDPWPCGLVAERPESSPRGACGTCRAGLSFDAGPVGVELPTFFPLKDKDVGIETNLLPARRSTGESNFVYPYPT